MIVALNVGNSSVGYGMVEAGELGFTGRIPTPTSENAFELEVAMDELLGRGAAGDPGTFELVVVSVVPALTAALQAIAQRRGAPLLLADETTVPIPMRVENPATAGHDRLVNAYAAARLHGAPAIVVDLGTATTFDVVAADGAFVGGAIAPGLGLGLDALAARTAQLPRVGLALPERPIGRDTVSAIQSGTVLGHIGLVTFLVRAISAELALDGGPAAKVVLTGGLSAHPWAAAIPAVDAIDPLLTLRGLTLLHSELASRQSVPSS